MYDVYSKFNLQLNIFRTPSANKEPHYKLRYDSPVGASPSRNTDHPKPFDEEEFDRSMSCRSSVGRSVGQIPNYNGKFINLEYYLVRELNNFNFVTSKVIYKQLKTSYTY